MSRDVPGGCGMNSGKSTLDSGSCGAPGPGNESGDSAGGICSESQKKPFVATSLHLCFLCCV